MAENPELEALRNLIVEAHAIVSTSDLPEGRSQRATEVLGAAISLAEDLLTRAPAAMLGKRGGTKTAERGPEYFKQIAGMRKTNAGGRPRKAPTSAE
jgi:hypothetical protein